jgi:hypothetical protein
MLAFADYKPLIEAFKTLESEPNPKMPRVVVARLQSMGAPNPYLSSKSDDLKRTPSAYSMIMELRNSLLKYIAHNYHRSKEIGLEAIIHRFFSDKTQKLVIDESLDLLQRMHQAAKHEKPAQF